MLFVTIMVLLRAVKNLDSGFYIMSQNN